jgi:putative DNA primase/helicase
LVCQNGTLNLDTLELEEHRRGHYVTAAVPYDYDPGADCPTLKYVLACTMGEATGFIQEFAGYALTVDTSHETAVWLQGQSGGGKSTLIGGIQAMLGARCGVLGLANIEQSRFGLTGIVGKTLLVATEQPSGYILRTNILNSLISGEPIRVEKKFLHPFEVVPRCKLLWSMNSLPRVKGGANGIFRRVKVVPVGQVPEDERDSRVKELVQAEGPGILNWALEGLARLRKGGHFEIPQCVQRATGEFKMLSDKPALFLEDMCELDPDGRVQSSHLYLAYKEWCQNNGYQPQGSRAMKAEWERLGLSHKRERDARYFHGVRLKRDRGQ